MKRLKTVSDESQFLKYNSDFEQNFNFIQPSFVCLSQIAQP